MGVTAVVSVDEQRIRRKNYASQTGVTHTGTSWRKTPSELTGLPEFAAPQVKRHRGEILFAATHQAVDQKVDRSFIGVRFEPVERRLNHFFGVAVEFRDKRRKESKRMATQGTQEASDRNGIRFGRADKAAHVAPMPPKASHLLATMTLAGL